jgi:hypothetical protein
LITGGNDHEGRGRGEGGTDAEHWSRDDSPGTPDGHCGNSQHDPGDFSIPYRFDDLFHDLPLFFLFFLTVLLLDRSS